MEGSKFNQLRRQRVAIVGAGWAGLAAAVRAVQEGHHVTLYEASRSLGGRARGVEVALPSGERVMLDNGQHVLLGAYRETLALMEKVGIDLVASFTRLPVKLGLLQTQPWSIGDYWSLVRCAASWLLRGFSCPEGTTVADLSQYATPRVRADVIDSLCLSALNTAPTEASGRVFLRVLKDAFSSRKNAQMLIPKVDLSHLFPEQAEQWLQRLGASIRLGERVVSLLPLQNEFDHVIVATPPWEAARLLRDIAPDWAARADALDYRAIATVYAIASPTFDLTTPLRALASEMQRPAQFVFKRAEIKGLLAFVVSDAKLDRSQIERLVLAQGEAALGVTLQPVSTIIERRATFACTAKMIRPAKLALAGLSVVGDYVEGPYPATIEGAVLSVV